MAARSVAGRLQLLPFLAVFTLLFWLTRNLPFFWDKDIAFSRIAHWIMQHPGETILPVSMDPGYPTVLAWPLALAWKWFGTSLPVMHLLMLPFTLGVVWQTHSLLRDLVPAGLMTPALLLVFIDTTLLAQTVVFSTDLVMLFFMLLAVNAVRRNQPWWLALAVAGLLASHMRGLAVAGAIGLFVLLRNGWKPFQSIPLVLAFLPGLLLFAAWAWHHYTATGWIGYHPDSPWAGCYEPVDMAGFLRNCLIVGWRLADFGRIVPLAVTGILLARYLPILRQDKAFRQIILLLVLLALSSLPPMLGYKVLNGHRYLIPVYFMLSLLTAMLLFNLPLRRAWRNTAFVLILAGMVSGNFWVYPDKVAKGWDATLAHLPWHNLRHRMLVYMEEQDIPVEETGSRTPNTSLFNDVDLSGDMRSFHPADLQNDKYIFYTNISNMFTDEEIRTLEEEWQVLQHYRYLGVKVILYARN